MPAEQIHVLLIGGDSVEARRLGRMLREAWGSGRFRLRLAHKLSQAKRYLQNGWADIAVFDLSLPDVRGPNALIETQHGAPSVPFIALSGTADDLLATQVLQLGVQDFLVKSEMTPGQLARALAFAMARHQAHSHLRSLSLMDELTGLHNRRGFVSLAEQHLKLAARQGVPSTLIFIDVDNLKCINDNFGHREGDYALHRVASLLRECFRESDIIGRLGGDEFCILLAHAGESGDALVRKRLLDLISRNNENSGRLYELSVSVGIVDIGGPQDLEQQISRADALMYEHKRAKQVYAERFTRLRELV